MQTQLNNLELLEKDMAEYLLDYHKGIGNAVLNRALAKIFVLEEITLRRIITKLVTVYKIPLGSTSGKHSGIFFISNIKERNYACSELSSRREELKLREESIMEGYDNWKEKIEVEQLQLIKL